MMTRSHPQRMMLGNLGQEKTPRNRSKEASLPGRNTQRPPIGNLLHRLVVQIHIAAGVQNIIPGEIITGIKKAVPGTPNGEANPHRPGQ